MNDRYDRDGPLTMDDERALARAEREEDDPDEGDMLRPMAGHRGLRRFRGNRPALIGAVGLGSLALLALVAGLLPLPDPNDPGTALLAGTGPSPGHWLGTDANGFDLLSRVIYGLRPPLAVGLLGQTIGTLLGTGLGVLAGHARGRVDFLLSRLTDLFLAIPSFMLVILLMGLFGPQVALLGGQTGTLVLIALIGGGTAGWPMLQRFARGQTLTLREREFVEAARALGTPEWRIIVWHILPSVWGTILVQSTFGFGGMIGLETTLSVLGLGLQPPDPDLGMMAAAGTAGLGTNPLASLAPGLLLTLILVAVFCIGDGLRDAFDQHAGG